MASEALTAFLAGRIEAATFRHVDHVRMAFEILRGRTSFPQAASAFREALRTMANRAGHPNAYHETITVAFLALIAERAATGPEDFEVFAAANPDLLDKRVLERWYAPDRLALDIARRTFILPEASR